MDGRRGAFSRAQQGRRMRCGGPQGRHAQGSCALAAPKLASQALTGPRLTAS